MLVYNKYMEIRTLANPPITEATLEIRFNPNKNITVENLLKFAESLKAKYPKQEPILIQSFEIKFSDQNTQQRRDINSQAVGYRLTNPQGNQTIIAAIDKLAISTLAPYKPWPELRDILNKLFTDYLTYASQTEITRLGMRYINKVHLPLEDNFDFQKYLTVFQPLPKYNGLPNVVSKFESMVTIPLSDIDCISNIRQVLLEPEKNEISDQELLPFILDIDVIRVETLKISQSDEIWESFDKMREKKNAIFFGTFNDPALEPHI